MVEIRDRFKAGLLGVACGDALGATVEFMHPQEIRAQYGVLREIVGGGWLGLEPGQVTDDTEMMVAVAKGIIEAPSNPIEAIGREFIKWLESGPIDVGATCALAIQIAICQKEEGVLNWSAVSKEVRQSLGERTAGNGALMRTLPVALAYHSDLPRLRDVSGRIALMTHPSLKAVNSCVLYCEMVAGLLAGKRKAEMFSWASERARELGMGAIFGDGARVIEPEGAISGYTIDTLQAALWAFQTGEDAEDVIVLAANLGGDADTVAAIAGGLAGVYYGELPQRWLDVLDHGVRGELEGLAENLVSLAGGIES